MCSCHHLSSFYFILEAGKYPQAGILPHHVSIRHKTPSKSGECVGPYTVPFDKVGMLVIWCTDETGMTVAIGESPPGRRPGGIAARRSYFGRTTVSMTWITPLEATMSVLMTLALSTITAPFIVLTVSD